MQKGHYRPVIMALGIMLALIMTGCATTPSGSGKSPRELMLSAGYEQNVADEPDEIRHFQKLPAGKMLCYVRGDQKCYAYKDTNTNSMYVGDEAAFKRYVDRIVQERMDQSYQHPIMQPNDPQFWNIWVDKQGGG